jgi:N-acetylmuramoyl-L-alanine amidase
MRRLVNRIVTLACVALLPACASMRTRAVKDTSKTFKTVVVDAGHGGKDSGHIAATVHQKSWLLSMLRSVSIASCANRN